MRAVCWCSMATDDCIEGFAICPICCAAATCWFSTKRALFAARLFGERVGEDARTSQVELLLLHPAGSMRVRSRTPALDRARAPGTPSAARRPHRVRLVRRSARSRRARGRDARNRVSSRASVRRVSRARRANAAAAVHSQRFRGRAATLSNGLCAPARQRGGANRLAALHRRAARRNRASRRRDRAALAQRRARNVSAGQRRVARRAP